MALVSKILEATLAAGSTAVTFTDSDIPNSLIRVFSSDSTVIPESRMLSGNTLTVVYPAQTSTLYVALEIVKQGLDIVDNLTSTDTDKALSANQGKVLMSNIETLSGNVGTLSENLDTLTQTVNNLDIPDNITDLDDINITSIQNGQVLAWNETSQKFVNVNQSGGSGETYTTNEQVIGTYLGATLYQKTFTTSQISIPTNSNVSVNLSDYGFANIDKILSIQAYADTLGLPLPYTTMSNGTRYEIVAASGNSTSLLLSRTGGAISNQVFTITLKYTKTS